MHHTGSMWQALRNVLIPLDDNGVLFIAINNDQNALSSAWTAVKKPYNENYAGRSLVKSVFLSCFLLRSIVVGIVKHGHPLDLFPEYKSRRGMSVYHDWLGDYPFEVVRPEEIIGYYRKAGLVLTNLTTTNRSGCNEFVFKATGKPRLDDTRSPDAADSATAHP